MTGRLLTSKDNPLFKAIRRVASQARRVPEDLVLAEGVRTLEEANNAGLDIDAALIAEGFGNTIREKMLLESWARKRVRLYHTSETLFRSVSDLTAPQGALALVRVPNANLGNLAPVENPLILCAWGIQDPGNLGTLIRMAVAAGASLICSMVGTVSARNPKVVRASAGTFFRIPVVERLPAQEFFDHCRRLVIQPYRTSTQNGTCFWEADFMGPCAVLLGNEGSGIPQKEWESLPCLRIPMAGGVESLNVSAAGAILLYEAFRQRLAKSPAFDNGHRRGETSAGCANKEK